jgi:exodeoxyribonuclease (lambda-induced)
LAIEQISGAPHGEPIKAWVLERGHVLEHDARMKYEARTRAYVTEAGICLTDDEIFGYSTDGLVDDDGLIEVKCPIDSIKIRDMWKTGDTSEYDHQMQGGMWITGRRWCDFIMYVPDLANAGKDLYVKRIFRNDAFIDAMVAQLWRFQKLVADSKADYVGSKPVTQANAIEIETETVPESPPEPQSTLVKRTRRTT